MERIYKIEFVEMTLIQVYQYLKKWNMIDNLLSYTLVKENIPSSLLLEIRKDVITFLINTKYEKKYKTSSIDIHGNVFFYWTRQAPYVEVQCARFIKSKPGLKSLFTISSKVMTDSEFFFNVCGLELPEGTYLFMKDEQFIGITSPECDNLGDPHRIVCMSGILCAKYSRSIDKATCIRLTESLVKQW